MRLFGLVVAAVVAQAACNRCGHGGYQRVAFDAGGGRSIVLFFDSTLNHTTPLPYYEVCQGGRWLVPATMFDAISVHWGEEEVALNPDAYSMVATRDGTVAALVRRKTPHEVIVLQDFASGESFPRATFGVGAAGIDAAVQRERAVRARLEAEHPEIRKPTP